MQTNSYNNLPLITIADFVSDSAEELNLELIAGNSGAETRTISSSRIQKLGLALAGFSHYIHDGRIQIVGQSEIAYLGQLNKAERIDSIEKLDLPKICCILVTKDLEPPAELLEIAERVALPVLRTSDISTLVINKITKFLEEKLAPRFACHGVMMGIYGVGVLVLGESGIGKSECALDLITRGHRLIADDAVIVKRISDYLEGASPEITFEHLEIRGLGILNIRHLFGVASVCKAKKIELIIELRKWDENFDIERVGLEIKEEEYFGVRIKKFTLPVSVGRNLSTLVETAVRVYLTNLSGENAAQKLFEKHSQMLKSD